MPSVQPSNYPQIETAIANIMKNRWPGMPVEVGDFSKITQGTPCGVVSHGELRSPLGDRAPQFEWLHWQVPVHVFFDYTSDTEAHELFRLYRTDLIALFQGNRFLDDGIQPNPVGKFGQAEDSKIVRGIRPMYFTIDGKPYLQSTYELWVAEKVIITYP